MARAWPQTFVEEANLKIQVSALCRALGDGQGGYCYIATVSGRGYNFVSSVRAEKPLQTTPVAPAVPAAPTHNLPFAVTRMIGREEAAAALVSRLSQQRLVTVVGPGGIGKTTLALAVAEQIVAGCEDGVWLVETRGVGSPARLSSMPRSQHWETSSDMPPLVPVSGPMRAACRLSSSWRRNSGC